MNVINDSTISQLVGWSLLHFVWQGALIAIAIWILLAVVPARKPNLRYVIACLGLFGMAIFPIATGWLMSHSKTMTPRIASAQVEFAAIQSPQIQRSTMRQSVDLNDLNQSSTAVGEPRSVPQSPKAGLDESAIGNSSAIESDSPALASVNLTVFESSQRLVSPVIPTLTFLWAAGVCLLSLKLMLSWIRVRRIQCSGTEVSDSQLLETFAQLKKHLKVNVSIPLRESIAVHSPAVIGWLRPVVLIPASAICGLSQQQLSAILVHELAHIRRADYLVNLLQALVETLLFYHPAVWWLSHRIRCERENCCDDLVLSICNDKQTYVSALLSLEQSRSSDNSLALASDGGDLVNRIARMLGHERRSTRRSSWIAALMALLIVGSLIAGAIWNPTAVASSPQQDEAIPVQENQPAQDEKEIRKIRVLVTDPDSKPLADASLRLGVWYQETANTLDFTTDENGISELPVPDGLEIYRLWAFADGFTPLFANWERDEIKNGNPPPSEFTFKMIPAIEVGGQIVDGDDQPIANVAVEVKGNGGGGKPDGRVRLSSTYALEDSVMTDVEGRWKLTNLPPGDDLVITLRVTHPDYISDKKWGDIQSTHSFGLKDLRDKSAKLVLQKGIKVRGSITDEAGDPIKNALVVWGDYPYMEEGSQEVHANADGTYETPTQENGELRITIIAPGYGPETTEITVGPGLAETDFVMSAGKRLEFRFVDEKGVAVPGAYAQITQWRSVRSLYNYRHPNVQDTGIPIRSDEDGVYVWEWAPEDAVDFQFSSKGYVLQRNVKVIASDDPITVVLKRPSVWAGTVTDIDGKPIPSFLVFPRIHVNDKITSERRQDHVQGKDGQFSMKIDSQVGNYSLMVEAEGYESTSTELFERDSPPGPFNIQMKPSASRVYKVVTAAGEPVPDATVIVAPTDQTISFSNFFNKFNLKRFQNTTTDSKGTFTLATSKVPRTLLVVSPEYYAEICDYPNQPVPAITLQKWSRLKYYITKGGQPWQTGNFLRENRYHNGRFFHIQHYPMSSSQGDGIFQAQHVAPMQSTLDVFDKGDPRGLRYRIAFEPEQGKEFDLDFTDCPSVKAGIKLSGDNKGIVDLAMSTYSLTRLESSVDMPAELAVEIEYHGLRKLSNTEVIQWFSDHENWDAMMSFQNCFDEYAGLLDENGKFNVDVLRPGKYQLSISAQAKTNGARSAQPLSDFKQVIEIGTAAIDLGSLTVPLFEDPEPNAMVEDFKFVVRTDKLESSLAKLRGNYVLLDFWTPWCDACEKNTPQVYRLANMLAAKKRTTMVSLMTNGSGPVVRVPSKVPAGLEWIDGIVSVADERHIRKRLGVWTSQHFVLIDPNGQYVIGGSFGSVVNKMEELGLK